MKKFNLAKKDLAFMAITGLVSGLYLAEKSFSKGLEKELEKRDGYLEESFDQFNRLNEIYEEKLNLKDELIKLQDEHLMMLDPKNYEVVHQKVMKLLSKEES